MLRDYNSLDPIHSRWLTPDPAGYRDGLNLYAAYMGVNGIDPLGLSLYKDTFSWLDRKRFERGLIGGPLGVSHDQAIRMSRYFDQYLAAESARPSDIQVAGEFALGFACGFGSDIGHSAKGTWYCFGDAVSLGLYDDYYGTSADSYRHELANDESFCSQAGLGFLTIGEKSSQAALIAIGADKLLAVSGIGSTISAWAETHPTVAYYLTATGAGIGAASTGWNAGCAINDLAEGDVAGAIENSGDALISGIFTQSSYKSAVELKPLVERSKQIHHYATNINKFYAPKMQRIADKYGLSLDGDWNKGMLPHAGRHPNEYHEFVLLQMERASAEAGDDVGKFLKLYRNYVIKPVNSKPQLLRKKGWE